MSIYSRALAYKKKVNNNNNDVVNKDDEQTFFRISFIENDTFSLLFAVHHSISIQTITRREKRILC